MLYVVILFAQSDSGDDAADGDRNDDTVVNRPANPEPPQELGESGINTLY
jgi:hypothetical protein